MNWLDLRISIFARMQQQPRVSQFCPLYQPPDSLRPVYEVIVQAQPLTAP